MKKKDKNFAGILALFFGWLGVHRYYLGQKKWGMAYTIGSGFVMWAGRLSVLGIILKFIWIPIMIMVSLIDAVTLFAMDEKRFDEKYNGMPRNDRSRETDFERPEPQTRREERNIKREQRHEARRASREFHKQGSPKKTTRRHNPYKKSGVEKFNDFDYLGAIEDFKKSLEIAPNDIATHFNLACTYSLTENGKQAFYHLDIAVQLGFRDYQKIKDHHALAYLRIQDAFDEFEENGYRLPPTNENKVEKEEEDLLNSQPDLLDQLNKLGDLRKRGLLTELEFEQQKKKLLG